LGGKVGEGDGLASTAVSAARTNGEDGDWVDKNGFDPVSVPGLNTDGFTGKHAHRMKKRERGDCLIWLLNSRCKTVYIASQRVGYCKCRESFGVSNGIRLSLPMAITKSNTIQFPAIMAILSKSTYPPVGE
jgi:hypothetical protein